MEVHTWQDLWQNPFTSEPWGTGLENMRDPRRQLAHSVAADWSWSYRPGGQVVHDEDPKDAALVPGAHDWHTFELAACE